MARPHAALTTVGLLLTTLGGVGLAQSSSPGPPVLDAVFPTGGQRGTTVEVTLWGAGLVEPTQVLVGGSGVAAESIRPLSENEVSVRLAIRSDADRGPRRVRVAGKLGLSDPAWFVVGTLPEVVEREPNDSLSQATPVNLPAVVSGTFGAGQDVDCFRFRGEAGSRCVAAIEAFQYDSQVKAGDRWQFTVPVFEVRAASGRLVASAAEGREPQPAICFTLPEDGEYHVEVHDLAYLGGARAVYRLTLGDVPYPLSLMPAGGRVGTRVPSRVSGLNLPGDGSVTLPMPAHAGPGWVAPFLSAGRALPVIAGDLPEIVEAEPNDHVGNRLGAGPVPAGSATGGAVTGLEPACPFPVVVNGRLDPRSDEDRVEVFLRKAEGIHAQVFAGRVLGSPVDLQLSVRDPQGRILAENDDDPATLEETRLQANSLSGDPRLEFVAPRDGAYTLCLRDLAGRGGPTCVYRLTLERLSPGFAISSRYDNPSLPGPGGTAAVIVTLRRWGGFTGAVRVRPVGLPPGYRGGEAVVPALDGGPARDTALVTVTAAADARPGDIAPFRIEGAATADGKEIVAAAEPRSPVGDNYRAIPFFRVTDGFVACVVAPREVVLSSDVSEVRGLPGATVRVPVTARWISGTVKELSLSAQSGHRAALGPPTALPAGSGSGEIPLRIPPGLRPGQYSFVVCPPPTGDYRWHRVDVCTPAVRLVVEADAAQSPQDRGSTDIGDAHRASPGGPPVPTPSAVAILPTSFIRPQRRAGQTRTAGISFTNDVLPALTRSGCNQGACHGAKAGRGGFRLSLWGFDPDADYDAVAREGEGRRLSRIAPGNSLLLQKPTLAMPHGGGLQLIRGSPPHRVLVEWLASGAPGPSSNEPRLRAVSLVPGDRILRRGARQRVRAWAAFDDGSRREVTSWVRSTSSQPGVASVAPEGWITAVGPGETVVVARYQNLIAAATVAVPFAQAPGSAGILPATRSRAAPPRVPGVSGDSPVDLPVERRWMRLGLVPAEPCNDGEFIRRVYLDLLGTLPDPKEVAAFLRNCRAEPGGANASAPAYRTRLRLIDDLLERPEWADYWTLYLGDLLRNNREVVGDNPMWAFRAWLRESLRRDRPFPEMLRDLVAAPGSLRDNPALAYYLTAKTSEELAETTSQTLLGVRLQCAKCHDHPTERWTQQDYFALAACFARVRQKGFSNLGKFGGDLLVLNGTEGEVRHPKTGQVLAPRLLGAANFRVDDGNRTAPLADWLASPANPFVPRTIVNRIWARLMGRGLVEPVDDFRASNPPSNPELLDALVQDFKNYGFRLKPLMRTIAASRTYQLSSRPTLRNQADDRFYSHYYVRRLGAEPLLDALTTVAGGRLRFDGLPSGTRAIALPDPLPGSYFLDLFGRPARVAVCECERDPEPNLAQALHLLNGDFLQDLISAKDGRVASLVAAGVSAPVAVTEIYRYAYSRAPTAAERAKAVRLVLEAPNLREGLEDLVWTLLNSREFLLNH